MNTKTRRLSCVGLISAIFFLAACAPAAATLATTDTPSPTNPPSPTLDPRTPVIIDTDMSMDGIMAIAYLLQIPEFSVKAITVAGTGEAHCGPGTAHALGLAVITDAGDVPVACGRETPLKRDHAFPAEFRQNADSALGINWPSTGLVSSLLAPELIQSIISNSAKPVVIVTDGPLTNIADAFLKYPELVKNVKMIYTMGGAINVPGNLYGVPQYSTENTAEFNIFVDPDAAAVVVESGAPITLVPLDITNQVPLDPVFYRILSQNLHTPAAKAVYDMLTYTKSYEWYGTYMWDQLTYVIASDETMATYETVKINVIQDGPEIGRTKVNADGHEVRVAMTTNTDSFMEQYLMGLNGGQKPSIDWITARATSTPPPNSLVVTIQGGKCTLDGSMQVNADEVGFYLINKDTAKTAGLAIATIDDDKTFADLDKWPSVDPPPWLQVVDFAEASPGNGAIKTVAFTDKPLYLVCFEQPPDAKIGAFGPIEKK